MNLHELQAFQKEHDLKFHRRVMDWDKMKQLEHVTLHLAKLTGLFSTYCEKLDVGEAVEANRLFNERIPDLLVFTLKLANLADIDLEPSYLQRIQEDEGRRAR